MVVYSKKAQRRMDVEDNESSTGSESSNDSQYSDTSNDKYVFGVASEGTGIVASTFITLDGLSSGVPTQTTPTLTPTTLRNIEQTFIELTSNTSEQRGQAGFVPPVISNPTITTTANTSTNTSQSNQFTSSDTEKSMWTSSNSESSFSLGPDQMRPTSTESMDDYGYDPIMTSIASGVGPMGGFVSQSKRGSGGRRPNKHLNISPEEEEKRRVRRERNKHAAAKCRQRRLDHTNELIKETNDLESKKQSLQSEVMQLEEAKRELETILNNHKPTCRIHAPQRERANSPPDIKPMVYPFSDSMIPTITTITNSMPSVKKEYSDETIEIPSDSDLLNSDAVLFAQPKRHMLNQMNAYNNTNGVRVTSVVTTKPNRPCSLPFIASNVNKYTNNTNEIIAGVPITTPSSGIPFNFDSLMEGGTGLTPVAGPLIPTCSTQQRNGNSISLNTPNGDLVTPDGPNYSAKLVRL